MRFEVRHQDHGVSFAQLAHVCAELEKGVATPGPFILRIELPASLGTVPCGLFGPVMGDAPVEDEDVVFWTRGSRPYADRCVDLPVRRVAFVYAIGELDKSGFCAIETIFGGPLAPMNSEDPDCLDVEGSKRFWAVHALSIPAEKDR